MEKRISNKLINSPILYGILSILIVIEPFIINFHQQKISGSSEDWAHFGDYFGGVLGPLFGLISFILVAATTRNQIESGSVQNFEGNLFKLLELHDSILRAIDIQFENQNKIATGRDVFRWFFEREIKYHLRSHDMDWSRAYEDFLERRGWELEHYYRTVYHIFIYIHENVAKIDSSGGDEKRYYDLVKSQLSRYELNLLYLNYQSKNAGNWRIFDNNKNANIFEHLNKHDFDME